MHPIHLTAVGFLWYTFPSLSDNWITSQFTKSLKNYAEKRSRHGGRSKTYVFSHVQHNLDVKCEIM